MNLEQITTKVIDIVDEHIHGEVSKENIESGDNLGDIGVDSLDKINLGLDIEKQFGLTTVPDHIVEGWSTVSDVCKYVDSQINKDVQY